MTTRSATLDVQWRTILGKGVKRLRREGLVPLHLYGPGVEPMALQVEARLLRRTLTALGRSRPVSVRLEGGGGEHLAFVRDIQFHPVSGEVLHVDLLRVDVGVVTRVEVPLELRGEAPAARLQGGSLLQALYSVLVEGRPLDIPDVIAVDMSVLDDFEKAIRVADLVMPGGVVALTDPEQLVAHVSPPVAAQEEAPARSAAAAAEPERQERPRTERREAEGEQRGSQERR